MPDVGFDRFLRKEQPLADLAIDQSVGNKLQYLDLTCRGLLFELPERRRRERDHRSGAPRAAPCCGRLETATVVAVAAQNLFALGGVHAAGIGLTGVPL